METAKPFAFKYAVSFVRGTLMIIENRYRSSRPVVFLGKGVLKICSKFTGEHLGE